MFKAEPNSIWLLKYLFNSTHTNLNLSVIIANDLFSDQCANPKEKEKSQ
jgi:hypothetical protein